jgi:hypothetical protein
MLPEYDALRFAAVSMGAGTDGTASVTVLNDLGTHAQVMEMFDRAIAVSE